jgi:hypothetical protein
MFLPTRTCVFGKTLAPTIDKVMHIGGVSSFLDKYPVQHLDMTPVTSWSWMRVQLRLPKFQSLHV